MMAGEVLQHSKSSGVVCLKRENTDMQLWKIEAAKEKIKLEIP